MQYSREMLPSRLSANASDQIGILRMEFFMAQQFGDVRVYQLEHGHALSSDLAGRTFRFTHTSGNVMEQKWLDHRKTLLRAVTVKFPPFLAESFVAGGDHAEQEAYAFELGDDQYLIGFYEAAGMGDLDPIPGYPVSLIIDFSSYSVMAAFVCPREGGGLYHVIDQGTFEEIFEQ